MMRFRSVCLYLQSSVELLNFDFDKLTATLNVMNIMNVLKVF